MNKQYYIQDTERRKTKYVFSDCWNHLTMLRRNLIIEHLVLASALYTELPGNFIVYDSQTGT
jgi:hypothetical protein